MKDLMTIADIKNPNYFNAYDLITGEGANGKPMYGDRVLTIADIKEEEVIDIQTSKKKPAWVIHFKERDVKPYVLSAKCVLKSLEKASGSPFLKNWIGKRFTFYVERDVKAFGKKVDAIRVRDFEPPKPKMYKCASCQSEINEQVYVWSMKKYSAAKCKTCYEKLQQEEGSDEKSI